jgi:hypothetical protein
MSGCDQRGPALAVSSVASRRGHGHPGRALTLMIIVLMREGGNRDLRDKYLEISELYSGFSWLCNPAHRSLPLGHGLDHLAMLHFLFHPLSLQPMLEDAARLFW